MSLFEVKPYDREVYEKELKDFLPQKILDVHTHVYLKEFFPPKPLAPGEVKRTVTWPSLVAADDSIEDLQETYRLMLPGKDVTALMFSNSGRSQQANDYVADASRRSGFPALYFSAPEESPEEVERQIRKGSPGQCFFCRAHLPPAAVHQKQIRLLPEPVAAGLSLFCKLCVLFVLCCPPGDSLCQ